MYRLFLVLFVVVVSKTLPSDCVSRLLADEKAIELALEKAGENRGEITAALAQATEKQRPGMEFLVIHMPEEDLKTLTAEFLLANARLAYEAWEKSPWREQITEELFFNNVLPYANVNEQRDAWRADFYERCLPMIAGAKTPTEAAILLNKNLFREINVKYSTKRNRADQGPAESMETGLASCTGLSILLIDACRAVGIPARFVGTPLWTNKSGNHSWVEIWDKGWQFTGACEPTGDKLNQGWFKGRAATAITDDPLHAIYAVSYKKTPSAFPMVWDPRNRSVSAVNVTDRYTRNFEPLPEGFVEVMIKVTDQVGQRVATPFQILTIEGELVFEGKSKDERFDTNDHCLVRLKQGKEYAIKFSGSPSKPIQWVAVRQDEPYTFVISSDQEPSTDNSSVSVDRTVDGEPSVSNGSEPSIEALRKYLELAEEDRGELQSKSFASQSLTESVARQAAEMLWTDHLRRIRDQRKQEMEAGQVKMGDLVMPFYYRTFGEKPEDGRSLYISMHGGGGAPPQVNDQQWENQKRLYTLSEGVYLVPRAPTNTWNLWHQGHIDGMFSRLIENMIALEDVNPDKVYLMGYSAGGDGVYQLAPRMADRFAAAAMMAGHPNETSPLGLRNLPFTLHMGGRDSAYKRNQIAEQWKVKLAELQKEDLGGYEHLVKIYPEKGHWMDRQDASAIPWMAKYRRQRYPKRVVWKQDDVTHTRFYWLAADPELVKGRPLVVATMKNQSITIEHSDLDRITIRLTDEMLDLDQPIELVWGDSKPVSVKGERRIATLAKTLAERGERPGMYSVEVEVSKP